MTVADDPDRPRELLTSNLCRRAGYEAIGRAVVRTAVYGHQHRRRR